MFTDKQFIEKNPQYDLIFCTYVTITAKNDTW